METGLKKEYNFHRYRLGKTFLSKGKDMIQVTEKKNRIYLKNDQII